MSDIDMRDSIPHIRKKAAFHPSAASSPPGRPPPPSSSPSSTVSFIQPPQLLDNGEANLERRVSFVEDEEEEEEEGEGDENEDNEENEEEEEEEEESSEESDEDTEADSDESQQQDQQQQQQQLPVPRSEDNLISNPDNTDPANANAATTSNDATPAPSPSTATTATTKTGKRGSRKHRTPSPSPPPPPPPPPPPCTIRLEISLGGPDNYEVNISSLAKATGQRPATPEPVAAVKPETTESGADDEKDRAVAQGVVKRKKRKSAASEYYDTTDPFIDDSELGLDQRTYFAQTKQQGFYVSSGEVVLLKENRPTTRKPKSTRKSLLPLAEPASAILAGPSRAANSGVTTGDGTRTSPIALSDGDENDAALGAGGDTKSNVSGSSKSSSSSNLKRKSDAVPNAPGDGRKKSRTEWADFSPAMWPHLDRLSQAVTQASWVTRGKFPPEVKPVLASVALEAIKHGDYGDKFFQLMPSLFPYNKFTMTKLIKRTIFADHVQLIIDKQEELLKELGALALQGFTRAQEEWEKSVQQWNKRQEKAKGDTHTSGGGNDMAVDSSTPPPPGSLSASVSMQSSSMLALPDDDGEGDQDQERPSAVASGVGGSARDTNPPPRRYKLTDEMKVLLWQIVALSNECCKLENEKNQLDGSNVLVSEQGLRKVLYTKIVEVFPLGWMTSGQISREVSVMKKRLEKEVNEIYSQGNS